MSSRPVGTNEDVSTLKESGGDYSSLKTWEEATDNDNVTAQTSPVLEMYVRDDAAAWNERTTLGGATNDATYFRIVRAASGQGHTGLPETSATVVTIAEV